MAEGIPPPAASPSILPAASSFRRMRSMRSSCRTGRDLTRFDVDFDLPERFHSAAFPPEMYLTSRPDLGDVLRQGKLVTLTNFFELFNGIISPAQGSWRGCACW